LFETWHEDIQQHVPIEAYLAATQGHSFAEIEELKNLLILHYLDAGCWNLCWALDQFAINRHELMASKHRRLGFDRIESGREPAFNRG
jgi:hypothetical protein